MVVKDRVGRRRYIAFAAPKPTPSRHAFTQRIDRDGWRLTVYTEGIGILAVPHTEATDARAWLEAKGATPLTTSGTIKGAKRAAGVAGA